MNLSFLDYQECNFMLRNIFIFFVLVVFLGCGYFSVSAQSSTGVNKPVSPLNPTQWGVVYDLPAMKEIKLQSGVIYQSDSRGTLKMDIYSPPKMKSGTHLPAVVFLNTLGDEPNSKPKDWEIYKTWARLAAANNLIGITMEADSTRIQENLSALFDTLEKNDANYGVDSSKIGIYAASANVSGAVEYLMSDQAASGIRAAVLYYGSPPEGEIRGDLPVLFVVAESDAQRLGAPLAALWQKVIERRAPWTLAFAKNLPHAFDAFSDTDAARRVIQQTIGFWKSHLEAVPQPTWKPSKARAVIASTYSNNAQKILDEVEPYILENPKDAVAYELKGDALVQLKRFEEAGAAYEKGISLGAENANVFAGLARIRLSQKRWNEAAAYLQKAIDGGMKNSLMYGQLGFVQLVRGENEDALKNYEKAFAAGIPPGASTRGTAFYNMAIAFVRLKQNDKAFEMLDNAAAEGLKDRTTFENDSDFAPLREDKRFQNFLERISKPSGK